MCRKAWIVALGSVVALAAVSVRAEVRAITDRDGTYKAVRVTKSGRGGVWSSTRHADSGTALNPSGDRNRDLWPTVREAAAAPHYPWAVWSRLNGGNYDLAWSRWTGGGWQPIRWLSESDPSGGADLDPSLRFDQKGRPFVVWWKDDGEKGGSVYLSGFLGQGWLEPFAVSAPSVDARYPVLDVASNQTLVVRYVTDEGLVEQVLLVSDPGTITDDINPMDCVHLAGDAVVIVPYLH